MGKFGGLAEAAVLRVKHFESGLLNGLDYAGRDAAVASSGRFRLCDRLLNHLRLLDHVAMLFFVGVGDAEEDAFETGAAVAIVRRKIGAAVEGLAIGSEKGGERPSALTADGADGDLVAAVDVGALVAVDFDGDE